MSVLEKVLTFFYPKRCLLCGRAVQWIDSVKMDAGKENGNVPLTAYY